MPPERTPDPITIACDESGSEGENVTAPAHRVFCHGSTDLSATEAAELIQYARDQLGTQAPELKSEQLLKHRARTLAQELFAPGGPLDGRCLMNLTDKRYFVIGKVVDLLVVELAHHAGIDLYAGLAARELAYDLFRHGSKALGPEPWDELLVGFNSLMRTKQRKGLKTTVDEFYSTLEHLEYDAEGPVGSILDVLERTRPQADEFQDLLASEREAGALDPLLAAVPATVHMWHTKTGAPIRVVHDDQKALTIPMIGAIVSTLRQPPPGFEHLVEPVDCRGILRCDSKDDPRVQVADLVAGMGRRLGTEALAGSEFTVNPHNHIAPGSVWGDNPSWIALTGKPTVDS